MDLITVITLIISMSACLMSYLVKKVFTDRSRGGMTSVYVFNAVGCVVSALVLFAWGGVDGASLFTVLLGALFGITVSLQGAFVTQAMQIGPMSYTVVITTCSTVFTALSGFFFFHERIGVFQLIGIVFMLSSFVFANEKKEDEKKGSLKWFVFSILAFIGSGGIGFMQKIHQTSAYKDELNGFLVIAFVTSFVFSAVMALIYMKRDGQPLLEKNKSGRLDWTLIAVMVISGICVAANHKLNLWLSGIIDSAVFFPLVNGGNLVLTTLSAFLIFRERLTRRQWIGVLLGALSVLFLCLPKDAIFSFALK